MSSRLFEASIFSFLSNQGKGLPGLAPVKLVAARPSLEPVDCPLPFQH